MNFKSILGFAFGPIATAALGLLSVPVIAWVFPPEDVGRLNLFQVTLSLVMMVALLGLDQAYVREYHTSLNKRQLLGACLVPGVGVIAVILLVTIFFAEEMAFFLYGAHDFKLYLLTVAALVFGYFSRFLSLILRMQERGFAFSLSQILAKAIQLLLVYVFSLVTFQKNFGHLLSITVFSSVVVFFICALNTRPYWVGVTHAGWRDFDYSKIFSFGLPLVVTSFAYIGINAVSTYVLRLQSNLSEIAVYSVAMSFAGVATLIQSIFSVVWTPLAFKWEANGIDAKRIDDVAQLVLAVICTLAALVGSMSWVLDFILPPRYFQVKDVLLCFMVQPLLYTLSVVTSVGIGFARKSAYSIITTVPAVILNFGICLLLVEDYGVVGTAIGSALAYFFLFVANSEAGARAWKRIPMARTYTILLLIVLLSILNAIFGQQWNLPLVWFLVLCVLLLYFRHQWIVINGLFSSLIRSKFRS